MARDLVQADLDAMGKAGQKISRAREKVFEILQTGNACTAWFREKDSNPSLTFRTLSFEVDRNGEYFVQESSGLGPLIIYRNPYVAKVTQDAGPGATVTLNLRGAFFNSLATVLEVRKEGGTPMMRTPRQIYVGPYVGDTLRAQALTLLHEFGHVLDLLPADENDVDGRSVQNTNEVLRYCRAEIESAPRLVTLSTIR